jgi:phenylacetate-CoA ligase
LVKTSERLSVPGRTAARLFWSAYVGRHMLGQSSYARRPLAAIRRDQDRRVRGIVAYAFRFVPYYRETFHKLGLTPSDFRTADDLSRLPLLEPEALRRDPQSFVSTEHPPASCAALSSAGSTGIPRLVYHDRRGLLQSAAHGERAREVLASALGHRFGYRHALIVPISSSSTDIQRFWDSHLIAPRGVPTARRTFSLFDPVAKTVAGLNEFRPDAIYTYGSYLEILFSYLASSRTVFHKPRLISFSSCGLTEAVRNLIIKDFGIPVFSAYQAVEALKLGFECEHHAGLHLNIDLYPVRVVDEDGRDLRAEDMGQVVVSNTVNRGTVLINYRLGDIAALLPGACPCGRTLPLMSYPQGRRDDIVRLPSGRVVHPQELAAIFRFEPQVWQYQVVHATPASLRALIVPAPASDLEGIRERILTRLRQAVKEPMDLEVRFVEAIPPTPGGKRRAVLSLCGGRPEEGAPAL